MADSKKKKIGDFTRNSVAGYSERLATVQKKLSPRRTQEISVLDNLTRLEVNSTVKRKKVKETQDLENATATQNLVDNLTNLSGQEGASLLQLEEERIYFYDLYRQIFTLIPEMAQAVEIIANNIMSPDIFGRSSFKAAVSDSFPNASAVNRQVKDIIKEFDIDDDMYQTIINTLILGDGFIAVIDIDTELRGIYANFAKNSKDNKNQTPVLTESDYKSIIGANATDVVKYKAMLESDSFDRLTTAYLNEMISFNPITEYTSSVNGDEILTEALTALHEKKEKTGNFKHVKSDVNKETSRGNIILKKINPSNTVKIVLDSKVLGYYIIEKTGEFVKSTNFVAGYRSTNTSTATSGVEAGSDEANVADAYANLMKSSMSGEEEKEKEKKTTHAALIDKITDKAKKFVMNNLKQDPAKIEDDLAKVLYHVLSAETVTKGEKINVSFVPAELMCHFSPGGDNYGRSAFFNSVFMSKLYLMTLMSSIMKKVARGSDQRVLYVESAIDADLEGVVEQVIKDMKQQSYSMNELGDLDSVVRTAAGFKDMLIPTINGNRPIDFDVIPGDDTDVDSPFLEFLMKRMVAGTHVPLQLLSGEDVDFARTVTSLNGNLVRLVTRYQADFKAPYDKLIRIIYSLKYGNVDIADNIETVLPPPMTLMLGTLSQNIGEAERLAGQIAELTPAPTGVTEDRLSDFRQGYKLNLIRELMPSIDWANFDSVLERTTTEWVESQLALKADSPSDDDGY